MPFNFKHISDTEFHVNNHVLIKDTNNNWVAKPPIESTQLQIAVNNYLTNLN